MIKPCYSCGSQDVVINEMFGGTEIKCRTCKSSLKSLFKSKAELIEEWNNIDSFYVSEKKNDFYEAVCRQFKDCKTANDIAVRSFELMQVIADVSWEANAVMETDAEGEKLIAKVEKE